MNRAFPCAMAAAALASWVACGPSIREETRVYRHAPQRDVEIRLHLPPDAEPGDRRPAIVFFYGGGFEHRRLNHFRRHATYYASRGIVAARADTRLVTDADDVRAEDAIGDAQQAVSWLRENGESFGIDPARIVVAGGSSGGLLAACAAEVPAEEAPKLAVLFNPVLEETDPEKIERRWRSAASAAWHAPLRNVRAGIPPTILFYGSEDAYLDGGRIYARSARTLRVDVRLYVADGEDHGFFNAKKWRDRTLDILNDRLVEMGILDETPPRLSKGGGPEFDEE